MTTSELIKLLQESDPDGNTHIVFDGGVPFHIEKTAGYYDGPYAYINSDNKYVVTRKGQKIRIHCQDMDGFMENYLDIHSPNNWDYVRSKYIFDSDKEEEYTKILKGYYDSWYQLEMKSYQQDLNKLIEWAKSGWRWYQNMEVDTIESGKLNNHVYYTWIILDDNGDKVGSCVAHVEGVLKSGLWEKRISPDMIGYYEWVYIG
jgi:hypothetical protein